MDTPLGQGVNVVREHNEPNNMSQSRLDVVSAKKHPGSLVLASIDQVTSPEHVPVWKRVLDIIVILAGLPVVLPVFILIALLIKIVSPGPIFYRQSRIGHRGRQFDCLKFRSMKPNAPSLTHKEHTDQLMKSDTPMIKMDHVDPRLIPFGRVLRASGLDELPQLINVLKGEMSIVGPRPSTLYEYENFLPWHKQRVDTLPGLTGLWQVSGKNKTTFTEMINLDIYYVRNKSFTLDLRIMWRTFAVLVEQIKEAKK